MPEHDVHAWSNLLASVDYKFDYRIEVTLTSGYMARIYVIGLESGEE